MADEETEAPRDSVRGIRQVMSAGGLVVAVVCILALGAILKTDSSKRPPPAAPVEEAAVAEPRPKPRARQEPSLARLTEKAPTVEEIAEPPPPTPGEPAVATEQEAAPIPEPVELPQDTATDPSLANLASRAGDDASELARNRGRWTLQLLVACKTETVQRYLERAPGASSLYLLPVEMNGNPCFRVCWGTYVTREAAVVAEVPPALRSGVDQPSPKAITELLP
jgi:septal ring-binding cell division protein DamX